LFPVPVFVGVANIYASPSLPFGTYDISEHSRKDHSFQTMRPQKGEAIAVTSILLCPSEGLTRNPSEVHLRSCLHLYGSDATLGGQEGHIGEDHDAVTPSLKHIARTTQWLAGVLRRGILVLESRCFRMQFRMAMIALVTTVEVKHDLTCYYASFVPLVDFEL
jgi:hypothetical protein